LVLVSVNLGVPPVAVICQRGLAWNHRFVAGLVGLVVIVGVEAVRRERAVSMTMSAACEERARAVWMVSLRSWG
jgi:hypothetical protein